MRLNLNKVSGPIKNILAIIFISYKFVTNRVVTKDCVFLLSECVYFSWLRLWLWRNLNKPNTLQNQENRHIWLRKMLLSQPVISVMKQQQCYTNLAAQIVTRVRNFNDARSKHMRLHSKVLMLAFWGQKSKACSTQSLSQIMNTFANQILLL